MTTTYENIMKAADGRVDKKIANNTRRLWLDESGGRLGVKFHNTLVLAAYPSGEVTIYTGGYNTVTTFQRINAYLGHGLRVWGRKESRLAWAGMELCDLRDGTTVRMEKGYPVVTYTDGTQPKINWQWVGSDCVVPHGLVRKDEYGWRAIWKHPRWDNDDEAFATGRLFSKWTDARDWMFDQGCLRVKLVRRPAGDTWVLRDDLKAALAPDKLRVSPMFTAILACIFGEAWASPVIAEMIALQDGGFLGRQSGDSGYNHFLGAVSDLRKNLVGAVEAAGLNGTHTEAMLKLAEERIPGLAAAWSGK